MTINPSGIPMVVDVMDASRPNMQENGNDIAIALDPILLTYTLRVLEFISRKIYSVKFLNFDLPEVARENKNTQAC